MAEDSAGIDLSQIHEHNRTADSRSANRYLKRVKYGNRTPNRDAATWQATDPAQLPDDDWMFEVVFDYGEDHYREQPLDGAIPEAEQHRFVDATLNAQSAWPARQDPFSRYRAGFEVRTYRLCRRALMFHHFPDELGADDYLVRSTAFTYRESPIASFITGATQSGYVRQNDGRYLKKSLPALEFEYSRAELEDEVREVDPESLENLPSGLDGAAYRWVDLDGEGLSGILTEQGDGWYYKRNLSPVTVRREDGRDRVEARFGPLEQVAEKPSLGAINGGRQQLLDLAGDGQLDLAMLDGPTPGFYERTHDERWASFRTFDSLPNIDWNDPNLRFVDLTGDGHADILITEDDVFTWYLSLAEAGFGPDEKARQALDEEEGPRLVFADGTQSVYLADISGDGLPDLARIRNGEVCYWPNLGYGRFGAKVTMDNAPWFDAPDLFDQRRIRPADIDGSGTTDIIYLGRDGADIYLNESGNRWRDARTLTAFPHIDDLASVTAVDLLGTGTACLVWSSSLPGDAPKPMRYMDLMGAGAGQKPHLLVKAVDNLGAETHVQYAPSTKFYLADEKAEKPWITKLPFPVHVVERVETYDRISRNRFVTRYAYHHGYFDGIEREFRGFGLVEQVDTEEFAALSSSAQFPAGDNVDQASHVPPVLTKTWFHTGAHLQGERISRQFEHEYYREPALSDDDFKAQLLADTVVPAGLTSEETREAVRALKGSMLRQEVYALDGTSEAGHPYTVSERSQRLKVIQPRRDNRHAVFWVCPCNSLDYHYERNPDDPRVTHQMSLEVDDFGNVLKSAAIAYGRRKPDPALPTPEDREKQTQTLITYTENDVTNPIDAADDYRTPLPAEARTYELTGYTPAGPAGRFERGDFVESDAADPERVTHRFDSEIAYEAQPTAGRQRRPIEHVRTLYRPDDLGAAQNDPQALLPRGTVGALALAGETYRLAFTPGLLDGVFRRDGQPLLPDPADVLGGSGADQGGYVQLDGDGHWWIPSGRAFHSPATGDAAAQELAHARQHFFLPHRYRDPFGQTTAVAYDAYDLLLRETRDPLDNRVTVGERDAAGNTTTTGNDYRVLQPALVSDPNRNRSAAAFDALGLVVGTAVMGKPEETLGDSLAGFVADLTQAEILDHLANPLDDPHAILGRATTRLVYDPFAYRRTKDQPEPQSAVVYTLARETHDADLEAGEQTKVQHSFAYSDGFGREIQQKIQAEPGPVPQRDAEGTIIVGEDGQPAMTENDVSPRWVGSGWTVFNNKGRPVRQYEPFFTDTHRFEFDVRIGVSPVLFYDPVGRVVATLHPNHTWEKMVFDPWQQATWDVNDTVLQADPAADPDVGDFFARLPEDDYLPTWQEQRAGGALGTAEQSAAGKAAVHANTPTIAHFDVLGRPFLSLAHNRFERRKPDNTTEIIEEPPYHTRVELDIEGNQRAVRDAIRKAFAAEGDEIIDELGRVVMRYDYSMVGPEEEDDGEDQTPVNRIHQASMEAGQRWTLNDVTGQPIRAWDDRGHHFKTEYDPLRRPLRHFVRGTDATHSDQRTLNQNVLFEEAEYGEGQGDANNHRGQVFQQSDGAGVVTLEEYDFKGNPLRSTRQLGQDYKGILNWSSAVTLDADTYRSSTTYDALNRPVLLTTPDNSVIRPTYNEANLLERVEANLRGVAAITTFVSDIDYDAKGQRQRIEYGNGVVTTYEYDPLTFRLVLLQTLRGAERLQDLFYTYDPVGNITHIRDDAQQEIYFRKKRVEPSAEYTYDAVYRLIEATGREHLGQIGGAPIPHSHDDAPRVGLLHRGDGKAMGTYVERYVYDAVGNILEIQHRGSDPAHPGWTRTYNHNEKSLVEDGSPGTLLKTSNRLSSTTVGSNNPPVERYAYDAHGNMIQIPHLTLMRWDYGDQLQATSKQAVNNGGTPETTYYVYDADGQRVRNVTERQATGDPKSTRMKERLYLSGFEIYREYNGNGTTVTLERETLHIMNDQQRIALVETRTTGSDPAPPQLTRYQFGNHLGSASLELDDQAQVISYEEYTPYGNTSYQAVRSQTETPKRYRYTGKEQDEESSLYYYGARYYAAWLGRWLSIDPKIGGSEPQKLDSTLTKDWRVQCVCSEQRRVHISWPGNDANSHPSSSSRSSWSFSPAASGPWSCAGSTSYRIAH